MSITAFDDFVIRNEIIGFFDEAITLKSGRKSHFYVNWRKATNDAYLLDQLTDYIRDFLLQQDIEFDSLIGVPEGASKTAVLTAMKLAKASKQFGEGSHIIPMGRAKPKEHGDPKDKYFIGQPQGKTIVLEDTITTGLSLINFLKQLKEAGIDVVAAIALTDRMELRDDGQGVRDFINDEFGGKIKYLTMSEAHKLLPQVAKGQQPSEAIIKALNSEFQTYGVQPLNLELP